MIRLEEKLIELGYSTENEVYKKWYKGLIVITTFYGKLIDYRIESRIISSIKKQQDIDKFQQAFDQLLKDLEVLKEHEEKD